MLVEAVSRMKIGDGQTEGVSIGPLITKNAANDVLALIDDAVSGGAKVAVGGGCSQLGECFVEPTVLTDVTTEMRVFREEIFGPVAPVLRFETEEEAVRLANETPFGLACYFFSRDLGRAWRVGEPLEYGIVGINEGMVSNEMAPFGGIKESGHGREGSKYGIEEYLEIKYMLMAVLKASAEQ
jgi:succinate-semialdehyde dehydrogenase/glutarate-semialdehyde dehydrogenase